MSLSTIVMPCNMSGWFDADEAARWGLVDFDWSNAKQLWANSKPMDCQERLVTQVKRVKAINPDTKTFVYRNLVKALPWYTSVREKLEVKNTNMLTIVKRTTTANPPNFHFHIRFVSTRTQHTVDGF